MKRPTIKDLQAKVEQLQNENNKLLSVISASDHDRQKAHDLNIQLEATNKGLRKSLYELEDKHRLFVLMAQDTVIQQVRILSEKTKSVNTSHLFESRFSD